MTKIKIVGALIFSLSIILALLFNNISHQNKINKEQLDLINEQKSFTQEIAKNIFYIYKNQNISTQALDDSIKKFINNLNKKNIIANQVDSISIKKKNEEIVLLWNEFYLLVQNFRDYSKTVSTYSSLILEKNVNNIYKTNLKLVVEFNELIDLYSSHYKENLNSYKNMQYILFSSLLLLLLYLFTQLRDLIHFIQKFTTTSKNIITNSTIKNLEPIEVADNSKELLEASNNFNFIIENINNSIKYSSKSIEHSYKSLESVEKNIEDLLEFISIMDNENIDNELTKKEDAIIQSLEELTSSTINLQNLQKDLNSLISHYKKK
ncbi:MAG: hypothetical protein U9N33_00270 [Campylobacterota bacterium]|nr:hypothetical protein [Campylobacterota bacterium]